MYVLFSLSAVYSEPICLHIAQCRFKFKIMYCAPFPKRIWQLPISSIKLFSHRWRGEAEEDQINKTVFQPFFFFLCMFVQLCCFRLTAMDFYTGSDNTRNTRTVITLGLSHRNCNKENWHSCFFHMKLNHSAVQVPAGQQSFHWKVIMTIHLFPDARTCCSAICFCVYLVSSGHSVFTTLNLSTVGYT